jgi:hypothetical protein
MFSLIFKHLSRVPFFFLISQCIIYKKKKAQSASKQKTTQSASSIQRKPKPQMPLGTQKAYKGAQ